MDFTKFLKEMDIIALLDDAPNDVGGLTADELKAKFDEGGKAIKDFINDVLLVELKNYTDEAPSPKDLEDIYDAIHEVVLGQIPDGTITEQKIADGAVSEKKLAPGTLDGAMPKVSMNAPTAADNIAAGYPIGKTWLRPNYTLTNLAYNKTAEEFVAAACAVSKAGQTFTIAGNGDDKAISAELTHSSASGWLYCVVTPDATAASASLIVGGETVALTVGEANTIQRRYTGESIKFEATYETANAAAAGTITVVNLTVIDEAATLEQVDESCRDVSDNTVFETILQNISLESVAIFSQTWQQYGDGEWASDAKEKSDLLFGYCWGRRPAPYSFVERANESGWQIAGNTNNFTYVYATLYYSDRYKILSNGAFELVEPQSIDVSFNSSETALETTRGKYVTNGAAVNNWMILFTEESSVYKTPTTNGRYAFGFSNFRERIHTDIEAQPWEFLLSRDRNAYPDGEYLVYGDFNVDNTLSYAYQYKYMGSPIGNSLLYYENNPDIALDALLGLEGVTNE